MRLLLLARHGQSLFNVEGLVNGDPSLDRGLSPAGVDEATRLGAQIAGQTVDLCVTSEFPRAQETARIALAGQPSPITTRIDQDLNDIRIGALEGKTLEDYRAWSDDLDQPHHAVANAAPYVFDEAGLRRAVARLRR
jgi:probable phosphoglycerate mutase